MVCRMSFADPTEGPSIAAIVTPWTPQTALSELAIALGKDGYVARAEALPSGYKAHAGELVQVQAFGIARTGLSAIVPVEVGRVFHVARILSGHTTGEVLAGWRRMSGFYPAAKVFWAGRPQWKDGEDPDHEVDYHVPKSQPAELRWPGPARVPLTARELSELLLPIVTPIKSVWTAKPLAPGAVFGAWILRSSPLV